MWPGLLFLYLFSAQMQAAPLPVQHRSGPETETQLLDVAVAIVGPHESTKGSAGLQSAIAIYTGYRLTERVQNSGIVGRARVVPDHISPMDVRIDGRLQIVDGRSLKIRITVSDAGNEHWFSRTYQEPYAADLRTAEQRRSEEPFAPLYTRILTDISERLLGLDAEAIRRIRLITELQSAERFAPARFAGYLDHGRHGRIKLRRLPAINDPDLVRARQLRVRDQMFIDVLQDYYRNYAGAVAPVYKAWLYESFREYALLQSTRAHARHQMLRGILKVFANLNPFSADRFDRSRDGPVGIAAGKADIEQSLEARSEVQLHALALAELAASARGAIEPLTLQLEEREVTLTGSAEEQYRQWQIMLEQLFRLQRRDQIPDPIPLTSD